MNENNITWADLKDLLLKLTPEQLAMPVIVFDSEVGELVYIPKVFTCAEPSCE